MNVFSADGFHAVGIEVTDKCNLKCRYCMSSTDSYVDYGRTKRMKSEKVFALIDEIHEMGGVTRFLMFHLLGEPLLHPDVFEFVKYAESRGMPVKLVTNGLLFNAKNVSSLIAAQPSFMKISLEYLDAEAQEQVRSIPIGYGDYIDRIIDVITNLIEHDVRTILEIDLFFSNDFFDGLFRKVFLKKDHDPLVRFVLRNKKEANLKIREFLMQIARKNDGIDPTQIAVHLDRANSVLCHITEKIYMRRKTYRPNAPSDFKNFSVPAFNCFRYPCRSNTLAIRVDGTVTACCLDYNKRAAVGNVYSQTLNEIIQSRQYRCSVDSIRRGDLKLQICRECQSYSSYRQKYSNGLKRLLKSRFTLDS